MFRNLVSNFLICINFTYLLITKAQLIHGRTISNINLYKYYINTINCIFINCIICINCTNTIKLYNYYIDLYK